MGIEAGKRPRFLIVALVAACVVLVASCVSLSPTTTEQVPQAQAPSSSSATTAQVQQKQDVAISGYRVVKTYPHDAQAFTQGLVLYNGFLYESTGLNGASTVRKVELETGRVLQQHRLDRAYFGEGLAEQDGRLVQLTWQSNVGFIYDLVGLDPLGTFSYPGEGWGLTYDGEDFIMSDGTETLRFLDPETFREIGRVTVTDRGTPVKHLNELEYVEGEVYANVWQTDWIARISPDTGQVIGWIDLQGLLSAGEVSDPEAVLNGIAYDPDGRRLFVTGKLWPQLFEIEIVTLD